MKPFFAILGSHKLLTAIFLALLATSALVVLGDIHLPVFNADWIKRTAGDLGAFGPVALVVLMVLAIVISPIPSGPIAVAAGALYGAQMGAALSMIGAEIGAVLAFGGARHFGFDAIRRSDAAIFKFIAKPRSQGMLMGVVFLSRLVPFISFDAVSYAVGLTNLSLARFALATAAGIVPICWTLAALGAGMTTGGTSWMLIVLLGGGITLVPLAVAMIRARFWR